MTDSIAQIVKNFGLDAQTTQDFVNGDPSVIETRLGEHYKNLSLISQEAQNRLYAFNYRGEWVTGTAYAVNDVYIAVGGTYDGSLLQVTVAHTSSGANPDADYAAQKVVLLQVKDVQTTAYSISDLESASPTTNGQLAYLSLGDRSGEFIWTLGDFSDEVASDIEQADYIASNSISSSTGSWVRFNLKPQQLTSYSAPKHAANAIIRKGAYVANQKTHIIAGIDSLTQGYFTGDDFGYDHVYSHFSEFIKFAAATVGNSGGYFSVMSGQADRFGANVGASSGFVTVINLPEADERRRRSFDFNGLTYSAAEWTVPNKNISWTSNRNWTTQRVFFLRQAGGGSFEVDHISQTAYRYSINTGKASAGLGLGDSATDLTTGQYELDYIDIEKLDGGSDEVRLRYLATGEMCVYGVLTDDGEGNCKFTFQSNSGFKVRDYVDNLDETTLKLWYELLQPSHYMLNGGTNDRKSSTVVEFEADYIELIERIRTGSAGGSNGITSDVLCISPNDLVNKGLIQSFRQSIYTIATDNKYGYLDHMQYLGDVEDALALGLMYDNTHPGYGGIPILAKADCDYFGLHSGKYVLPDAYDDDSGGGAVGGFNFSGSLKSLGTEQITAGNSVEIYNIGLREVANNTILNFEITGQRTGQDGFRAKRISVAIRNSGTGAGENNKVTFAFAGTLTEFLGNATGIDFTVTAAILSNRLSVTINALDNTQNFSAKCEWYGRAFYSGTLVYENAVSDPSLVTYDGDV